jgi:CDP-diacylglycerol--serine O-phosphatidyltransferase
MNVKSQIPNFLTLSNLICGVLSIAFTAQGDADIGAWLIVAGAFFDFFDGLAARLLKVQGPLGKELDSLADVVSFGVAPAFIGLHFTGALPLQSYPFGDMILMYIPLVIAGAAAYRLAKFNIDPRQSDAFIGMPTPANAMLWLSFPLILRSDGVMKDFYDTMLAEIWVIALLSIIVSVLMVSELKLISLKFKNLDFSQNILRYILLFASAILLLLLWVEAIPIILLLYIVLSIIQNRTNHGIQSRN